MTLNAQIKRGNPSTLPKKLPLLNVDYRVDTPERIITAVSVIVLGSSFIDGKLHRSEARHVIQALCAHFALPKKRMRRPIKAAISQLLNIEGTKSLDQACFTVTTELKFAERRRVFDLILGTVLSDGELGQAEVLYLAYISRRLGLHEPTVAPQLAAMS